MVKVASAFEHRDPKEFGAFIFLLPKCEFYLQNKNSKMQSYDEVTLVENLKLLKKKTTIGQAWWLTPVIPALLGVQGRWITRTGVRDHPGQHDETPSLLKIQK